MSNYRNVFNPENENHSWTVALQYVKDKTKVLEVGCGNGNFAAAIKQLKKCSVDAVEPDKGDAQKAKKVVDRLVIDTLENSIKKLDRYKYDQIIFLDVIEHLYTPIEALKAIKNLLKPNGTVLFSIPNMAHASVRLMLMEGKFEYGGTGLLDSTHLHFYTEDEINRIFNEAGYEIKDMSGTTVNFTKEIITHELRKLGVNRPTNELINLIMSRNAQIYQYIGTAIVSSRPKKTYRLQPCSPMAEKIIEDYYSRDVTRVTHQLEKLRDAYDDIQEELEMIKSSRSYRLARGLAAAIYKVKRK